MYAETDFILALIKDDDWLQEKAEQIYREEEDLWTSKYTLLELLLVAYREGWNPVRIVANTAELVEIDEDAEDIKAAATYMEENDMTPFDALHLVKSKDDKIVSSDDSYDNLSERLKIEET